MASIRKVGGRWRAEVCVDGRRQSKMCDSKREAQAWSVDAERRLSSPDAEPDLLPLSFADACQRYADTVSPQKRGGRREVVTLLRWIRSHEWRLMPLSKVKPLHVAAWRDARRLAVSDATVAREWTLLRSVFELARREWGALQENPMADVKRPPSTPARTRRPTEDELARISDALGYCPDLPPVTQSARIGVAMWLSVETALRAGEILGLSWPDVDFDRRVVRLSLTKNGDAREVPLSNEAVRLLVQVQAVTGKGNRVIGVTAGNRDALWRKARATAGVEDLHFHDLRAEALTRLSKKVDVLTLARISGHRDLKMLMVYYRESMAEVAGRLG